jgi:uncharacterized membrane protein YkvA (DUF1232 family)
MRIRDPRSRSARLPPTRTDAEDRLVGLKSKVALLRAVWGDPRTPRSAKLVLGATVAYLLSPIDIIPDFIPVIGHLDDAVIVPLGILLAWLLVPRHIWREHSERLRREAEGQPPGGEAKAK